MRNTNTLQFREPGDPAAPRTAPERFTRDTVSVALNKAADEVLQLTSPHHDELMRDAVNLVVNAGLHFLDHPGDELAGAIEANYDASNAAEILAQFD